jgi:pyruvate/2-oxoglutarate dehydrogenase complex dihydrolipoamide acyltransferase (E2) component
VTTVTAAEMPLEQLIVVTGTLAAEQEIILGMKVAGRISELPVDLGSIVQKGDVIARLDTDGLRPSTTTKRGGSRTGPSSARSAADRHKRRRRPRTNVLVREARATMDGTKFRLDRAQQLYDKGLMAKSDFDVANSHTKSPKLSTRTPWTKRETGRVFSPRGNRNWKSPGNNSPMRFSIRRSAVHSVSAAPMWSVRFGGNA